MNKIAAALSNYPQKQMMVNFEANLSRFKTIDGNRTPNLQHVRRLTDSIKVHGFLLNPIIVNEKFEVIDGQHRLMAAKEVGVPVYYIVASGYSLAHVHTLNLNQKNWQKADYMQGYAKMGVKDYIILKEFFERHEVFTLPDCIAMCSNISSSNSMALSHKNKGATQVFEEGSWKVRSMQQAEQSAERLKLVGKYYEGYAKSGLVGTLLDLFNNPAFDFDEFMAKLRLQPTALIACANRAQYKALIESIYNYRRREKVNLRLS